MVRSTRTRLESVETNAALAAAMLGSLVRESGTVAKSSTISSRLTLVFLGVVRWSGFALARFRVVAVLYCGT